MFRAKLTKEQRKDLIIETNILLYCLKNSLLYAGQSSAKSILKMINKAINNHERKLKRDWEKEKKKLIRPQSTWRIG